MLEFYVNYIQLLKIVISKYTLEDRGAQALLILAPVEGFRGPSAPFGGLRPLLWGLRPLLEAYGLSQYHQ